MNIQLLNIDCLKYMATLPDKAFELAIVDPPYGLNDMTKNINGRHRNHIKTYLNKETPGNEYFQEVYRVSQSSIIWGCQYYINELRPEGSFIVWDKIKDPDTCNLSSCDIAWYSKRKQIRTFKGIWNGAVKINNEQTIHPHQKPVSLYKWLLRHYAKPADKILDTHLGSGSIAIACHDLGFDLTGCEIDKDYFDAAVKRFNDHKKQLTMF